MKLPIKRLDPDLPLPKYAKVGDAGCDLLSAEDITINPGGGRALVPTGLALAIPEGYAGFVQPRSGLAVKNGVTAVGIIDGRKKHSILFEIFSDKGSGTLIRK